MLGNFIRAGIMISQLCLSALLILSRIENLIHTVAFACCTTLIVENDQFVVFNVRVTENEHKLFGMGLEAIPSEDTDWDQIRPKG